MSDLRIALIAEGPTDFVVIEAALKAILPRPFILTQLQPEATQPEMGNGWGGVLKWCYTAAERFPGPVTSDPTLNGYDMVIIHLDVDVASFSYADCGANMAQTALDKQWQHLPLDCVCPPATNCADALLLVIQSWLGTASLGQSILCLPSQSSGTWLAAAYLPAGHALLANEPECNDIEGQLGRLPKAQKVRKSLREYRAIAPMLTNKWSDVTQLCSQALRFEQSVQALIP
ncbi:hypothetical protein L5M36_23955 [Shewanella sp. SM72]|jgi:hypothetical protein|uniref:hypothetical protein n=1 Tax=Shewanella sp. SM72 TaxID=2912805 RepID=UPI0021DB4947|nr:hypothetical protein [Shewanella sp. SM72]MCU8019893.1 hypothetical protein [Shewanella sp. SM72]